jgi:hypothetical protein
MLTTIACLVGASSVGSARPFSRPLSTLGFRLWNWSADYVHEDHRTPEERKRHNEELLRQLPALLKPEVFQRVLGLVGVDDNWHPMLKAGLDHETFLDEIEAIVTIQHDAKSG